MKMRLALAGILGLMLALPATAAEYVALPGGSFTSVLPADGKTAPAQVEPFRLRTELVTNGEFLAFVKAHPEWQRDKVASILADARYLTQWEGHGVLGDRASPRQPVTRVSWFAAQAYCESEQARLPSWYEWEFAAAADATRRDARKDAAWREDILGWYSRPSSAALPSVGGVANIYGVRDMNGLVWEWVDDFNALMVASDSRQQGDPDLLKFCGAGAISMQEKENYAVLMRIAMLSALKAADTTNNMGFRCAKSK